MIDSSREEFEKLPVIKNRIANFNLKYSGELNGYVGLKQYQSHVDFIDGCWFMFQQQQSQQAKIDELQARVDVVLKACDNLRKDIIREHHAEYDKGWKDCATSIYHQLKGNKDEN